MSESEQLLERMVKEMPEPVSTPSDCGHEAFAAAVAVGRMEDSGKFVCEVRVICVQCREPFRFVGLNAGVRWDGPTSSIDGIELLAPIEPEGEKRLMDRATFQMPVIPVRH